MGLATLEGLFVHITLLVSYFTTTDRKKKLLTF